MAKIYGEIGASALMTFDKSFSRSNGQPLDSTEVFYSKSAAETYAAGEVAYVGQKIVVIETVDEVTTVTHYGIEPDNSLKELGAIPVGDGVTVEVVDGKIQLAGLEDHETGTYQPYLVDGKIEWRVPSATTVEGLDSRLTTAEGDINALEEIVGNAASEGVEATGLVKNVADNAAAIAAEVTARETADKANSDAIDAINTKIGEVADDKTVVEMIADAQTAATYDDTGIKADIKANADAIAVIETDYLKIADKYDDTELAGRVTTAEGKITDLEDKAHEHANKDVIDGITSEKVTAWDAAEQNAVDRILGYLAEEEINANYDTLKEVAAWIESDTTASAELITRVSDIEKDYLKGADKEDLDGAIDALSEFVGDLPEGATSATVVAYIQEVIDDLKIGDYAKAADLTALAGRVVTLEGEMDTAQADIETLKTDKADASVVTALQETVGDMDTAYKAADTAMDGRITALENVEAEKNIIASVDEAQFNVDADRKLTLLDVAMSKVTGLNDALAGKVAIEDGKRLMTDAEGTKLDGIAAGAQVNVIDSVDTAQFGLDEAKNLTLLDIAIGKVTGLQDALDGKAAKATTLAGYGITDAYTKEETLDKIEEKITEINGGESAGEVLSQLNSYKEINDAAVDALETKVATVAEGAQVNVLEAVKINGTVLEIADKAVNIPVATGTILGVVMSSNAENKVAVAADGTMEINSVNVNKLVQSEGEFLVLNGGAAAV